jgi:glycosyl transferase family 25
MAKTEKKRGAAKYKARAKLRKVVKTVQSKRTKVSSRLAGLRCVVINLKDREDRWLGIKKSASKNAPWLKMERIDAVNGRLHPPPVKDVCKKYSTLRMAKLFHWYRPKMVDMSGGERGCCASHLKAWRECVKSNKPLIVLEDDAVLLPAFTATLEKAMKEAPKDIGTLWLTSKDRGARKRAGDVLMEPSFLWTTVGYVIWPRAAKQFMKLLPMDLPVDNWMAWHVKEKNVKGFSVRPACVRQANTWNIGSDVAHSDDVALWNHPSNKNVLGLC